MLHDGVEEAVAGWNLEYHSDLEKALAKSHGIARDLAMGFSNSAGVVEKEMRHGRHSHSSSVSPRRSFGFGCYFAEMVSVGAASSYSVGLVGAMFQAID
jgi:hypothetical protein